MLSAFFLRRIIRRACFIIGAKEAGHDGCLHRQRISAERTGGLSAPAADGAVGGAASPSAALCAGRRAGRCIRIGRVPAVGGLSVRRSGQTGGGDSAGADGFWRGRSVFPPDAVVFRPVLRLRRRRAGAGASGRTYHPPGAGHFLYQHRRKAAGDHRVGGVSAGACDLHGSGKAGHPGAKTAGDDLRGRETLHPDRPAGQWKRLARLRRSAGTGGGAAGGGSIVSPGNSAAAGTGRPACGTGGTAAGLRPEPAAAAVELPFCGAGGRPAAVRAEQVDEDRRNNIPGSAYRSQSDASGRRISGAVGRSGGKGKGI